MTDAWSYVVGSVPYRVVAYERLTKGGVVYLRWRARGNWRHRSLKVVLRDERGRIIRAIEQKAQHEADRQLARLTAGVPDGERPVAVVTLADGLAQFVDPRRGAFPSETAYLKEVRRSVAFAQQVLGADRPWIGIKGADLREVWRQKITALHAAGDRGHRGAVVVIARLLAVAQWLRNEELIPLGACVAPKDWRARLANDWREITGAVADYDPERPRHTLAEMRAILARSAAVDPRFHLLMVLGAELRLGQVVRARRRDVDLVAGTVVVRGRGKKGGAVVVLTAQQRAVLEAALRTGYLRHLEAAGGDFPLFPAGKLPGQRKDDPVATEAHRLHPPSSATARRKWFRAVEQRVGIAHLAGRGYYGLRRVAVDAAIEAGISLDGLQASGGWTDSQVPTEIYRAKDREKAQHEAAAVRARTRGENVTEA